MAFISYYQAICITCYNSIMAKIEEKLFKQAERILEHNWTPLSNGGFTKPSAKLYPFQWNWDSGFIAYGYTHFNIERAIKELRSLFKAQWRNGMLPHIAFHRQYDSYFPGPKFWQSHQTTNQAPENLPTSGITQPPLHAMVVWHIYKELPSETEKTAILKEFYPKLLKLHRYLLSARDPEGWGLVTIYHPWESGFDNSPRWDKLLNSIEVDPCVPGSYERKDIKLVANPSFRPSDKEYDRYISLALNLKRYGYDDKRIYPNHPFKIKDQVFSSLLYMGNIRLRKMALILGEDTTLIDEWIRRFQESLLNRIWSEKDKCFFDYNVVANRPSKVFTVASLIPLITGLLTRRRLNSMTELMDKTNFCGNGKCAVELIPSVGVEEDFFRPISYWRGPIWFNVNWLLWKGFKASRLKKRAEHLRRHMINLVWHHGFYEYYNPLTAEGLGGKEFSWTAALTIDLLSAHKNE